MSATFLPPLKHRTLANTAIIICNDPEVRCFINELNFPWDKNAGKDRWKHLLDKAAKKISELHLPPQLHQSVMALIKPIALEIARWKSDHLKVLGDKFDFISCQLYWKPEGIIDREKTAKMLVRNKNLCKANRFFLACCYCLEDEVKRTWNFLGPEQEYRTFEKNFSCIIFWRLWIQGKGAINWSQLSQHILHQLYPSTFCNYRDNPLWLRCFFDKLTPEEKKRCIANTVNNTFKEHDNFRFIISQLDENQRESVFKENPVRLLRFFLDWPYQSLFSEAAEQMWKYLQETDFRRLLHFIIFNRIAAEWYDFDYVNLLIDFWRQSPKNFKGYIKRYSIFEPVKMVICHDFLKLFPMQEIIQSSSRIEWPNDRLTLLRDGDFLFSY
ncbi:hypothetical protein AVEN_106593-1 [Araneus ventricosus]|uniref:Uncharacterized protein n=1 Tax=Araneus ventricosus TaxID=182803 RepID=A0A4Y2IV41_ARAVE|nr:hypothetical protein AVEN_106593-1 [Araneus ventricosus]